jgi:hypothetical protein
MTEADQRLPEAEGHEAVPWKPFGDLLVERGEYQVDVVEMRKDEPTSEGPSPHNAIVTTTVLVAWSDTLISVLKKPATMWWPVEAAAFTIGMYFKSLPIACQTRHILELDDLTKAFEALPWFMATPQCDANARMSAEWRMVFREMRTRGSQEISGSSMRKWMKISFGSDELQCGRSMR